METRRQRPGLLISAILHLMIVLAFTHVAGDLSEKKELVTPEAEVPVRIRQRVFLPPKPPIEERAPVPRPTPPPATGLDRISIGGPNPLRRTEPLVLRRDEDLTRASPKGVPFSGPSPSPDRTRASTIGRPASEAQDRAVLEPEPGLPLRPESESGMLPAGREEAQAFRPGPSIASSLRRLGERLPPPGQFGLPSGTAQQVGPLLFDPEGADFTLWINQFKNEVYRNWILPQPALLGLHGSVEIEFTVERDGRLSALRLLKSSRIPAFDRAAENALRGSRWGSLPADYAPPRVTMQATFFYNESPRES